MLIGNSQKSNSLSCLASLANLIKIVFLTGISSKRKELMHKIVHSVNSLFLLFIYFILFFVMYQPAATNEREILANIKLKVEPIESSLFIGCWDHAPHQEKTLKNVRRSWYIRDSIKALIYTICMLLFFVFIIMKPE